MNENVIRKSNLRLCRDYLYKKQNITQNVLQEEFVFHAGHHLIYTEAYCQIFNCIKYVLKRNIFYDNNYVVSVDYDSKYKGAIFYYSAPFTQLVISNVGNNSNESSFFNDVYYSYFYQHRHPIYETRYGNKTVFLEKNLENYNNIYEKYYNKKAAFINAIQVGEKICSFEYEHNDFYDGRTKIIDFLKNYQQSEFENFDENSQIYEIMNIYQWCICPDEIYNLFLETLYNVVSGDEVEFQ